MESVPQITEGSISGMTGLSIRPVYFLNLNNSAQPTVVVKGELGNRMTENDATVSIKWSSKLMKNVNNRLVNTKIMTPAEISVFKAFAAQTFNANSAQANYVSEGTFKWVKMPHVVGLSDADYYSDYSPIPAEIKKDIVKFLDDDIWRELGKVVAVDIFNGNSDRFNISFGKFHGDWVNQGNVMFLANGQTKVIGLDTFDTSSGHQPNLASTGGFEELKILTDPEKRKTFAENCAKSVGHGLYDGFVKAKIQTVTVKPENSDSHLLIKAEELNTLFLPFALVFEQGLATGADQLKQYLQAKVRQYRPPQVWQRALPGQRMVISGPLQPPPAKTIPQGILDRMNYLDWFY